MSALLSPDPVLVDVQELTVQYHKAVAVTRVSLQVREGEALALIGPDGAGKTSLLRTMAGLVCPTGGQVTLAGQDAWRHRRQLRHLLGYLPQNFALYGDLSVEENLAFFGHLWGLPHWRQRGDDLLERLGLAPFRQRRAEALSGGMKQKLALAVSLLHQPRLLLLDEPTTGVDPITRREFWRLLSPMVAEGLTLVWATPYLDEAQRATRVVLMHGGRILAQGEPEALTRALALRVLVVEGDPRPALAASLRATFPHLSLQPFGAGFHVILHEGTAVPDPRSLSTAGVTLTRWEPTEPSLEDLFLYLMHGQLGGSQ